MSKYWNGAYWLAVMTLEVGKKYQKGPLSLNPGTQAELSSNWSKIFWNFNVVCVGWSGGVFLLGVLRIIISENICSGEGAQLWLWIYSYSRLVGALKNQSWDQKIELKIS